MKLTLTLFCSLLLFATLVAGTPNVSIHADVKSENKTVDKKSADEIHSRWLVVRITNLSSEKLEGLELKWTLYADDLKRGTDGIVVEKSGAEQFSLEASGRYTDVKTPEVSFKWAPQHSVRTGSGRSARYKMVPEAGHRYHGYALQVIKDGVVLGEVISGKSMRISE